MRGVKVFFGILLFLIHQSSQAQSNAPENMTVLRQLAGDANNTNLLHHLKQVALGSGTAGCQALCLYVCTLGEYGIGNVEAGCATELELRAKFPTCTFIPDIATGTSEACTNCDGAGKVSKPCPMCHGTGTVESFYPKTTSCPHCRGKKILEARCDKCQGRKPAFSRAASQRS